MEIGLVKKIDIEQEMQQAYLDYAMSVIVSRALPDARDGLKPVQRRILFGMHDMGLRPDSGTRKSARIVGEVLGKYHPHGDVAVYEAMARLAQDFSMRYPLVDGQGNFGSIDGDPPAAMRYTEASLLPMAMEILNQLDRNTVDFSPNFDGTLQEPDVLPAAVPNLLLNGASGIAVGMATNIPPHNLVELVNAMVHMIERWDKLDDVSTSDLMKYVKGPDFPTGGIVLMDDEKSDMDSIYSTGRGRFTVRGVVHLEEMSRGRNRILVTELPYTVNKASLIERIAELTREGKMDGISDIRDESDRNGMRIIIELSKTAEPEKILADLYHKTALQTTFGMTILALDKGEPRLLSLKRALKIYLDHRIEVVSRRSKFDLEKAKQREHILAGLRIAVNNIDEIIAIIRKSADVETARTKLMQKFKLSEIQANAILDMQLRRLAALERKKIEDEYKEITATIKELEALLKSPKRIRQLVQTELEQIREKYGDRRRTQIYSAVNGEAIKAMLTMTDMMPVQQVWLGMTDEGMLARSTTEKLPKVTGKLAPCRLIKTDTHHLVYVVTKDGKAFSVRTSALPETDNYQEGALISKFSSIHECDTAAAVFTVPSDTEMENCYVITVSQMGMIKKSSINDLPGPSSSEFVMSKVNDQDNLIDVLVTDGEADICLVTARGMLIRFPEKEIRAMGLIAAGVNGMKLTGEDVIIGAFSLKNEGELLLVSNNGLGWRFDAESIPVQGRYGQGVIACKLKEDEEIVGFLFGKPSQQGIVHFQKGAAKSVKVDLVPVSRRNVRGKTALPVKEGDEVYQLTPIIDEIDFWEKCAKPDKPVKSGKTEKSGKPEKTAKAEKTTEPAKTAKTGKPAKTVNPKKTAKSAKSG